MEREELTIMYLQMAGLDYHTASMEQREPFSFSKEQQETILKALKDSVQGAAICKGNTSFHRICSFL